MAGARAAVEAAAQAFPAWSGTAPEERQRLLERARELLLQREAAIAALVGEETGATLGWGGVSRERCPRPRAAPGTRQTEDEFWSS